MQTISLAIKFKHTSLKDDINVHQSPVLCQLAGQQEAHLAHQSSAAASTKDWRNVVYFFKNVEKLENVHSNNNNNNLTCKAPVCAKRKTSVALADRTSR